MERYKPLNEKLKKDLYAYIDENLIVEKPFHISFYSAKREEIPNEIPYDFEKTAYAKELSEMLSNLEKTFSEKLFELIDKRHITDVECYNKSNVDRKVFSKIRSNKQYRPSKDTAVCLSIGLELSLEETNDLLARAGYTLSLSNEADVIISYFIKNKIYDLLTINDALYDRNQKPLCYPK